LSHIRPRDSAPTQRLEEASKPRSTQPDAAILDHERRRKIEIQCIELQDELEEKGYAKQANRSLPDDEVQARVASLRRGLRARLERAPKQYFSHTHEEAKQLRPSDTHNRGAAKEIEAQSMQRALRIRPDYEEGQAFDPVWQERRKWERIEQYERRREAASVHESASSRISRWDREERPSPGSSYREHSPPKRTHVSYDDVYDAPPADLSSRTPSPPPTTERSLDVHPVT